MDKEHLRAEVERISFRNEENGFSLVRMRGLSDGIPLVATGHFPMLRVGEMYEVAGSWTKHPQYGPQFKIDASIPIRPTEKKAMMRYLAGGFVKGIGPKTAEKIVAYFGQKTFEILDKKRKGEPNRKDIRKRDFESVKNWWVFEGHMPNVY